MNNRLKKAIFIDRDGTLIAEPADEQIDSFAKLRFMPGALTQLALVRQLGQSVTLDDVNRMVR